MPGGVEARSSRIAAPAGSLLEAGTGYRSPFSRGLCHAPGLFVEAGRFAPQRSFEETERQGRTAHDHLAIAHRHHEQIEVLGAIRPGGRYQGHGASPVLLRGLEERSLVGELSTPLAYDRVLETQRRSLGVGHDAAAFESQWRGHDATRTRRLDGLKRTSVTGCALHRGEVIGVVHEYGWGAVPIASRDIQVAQPGIVLPGRPHGLYALLRTDPSQPQFLEERVAGREVAIRHTEAHIRRRSSNESRLRTNELLGPRICELKEPLRDASICIGENRPRV